MDRSRLTWYARLAWEMGKRDLRNRYASSYAGAAWLVGVPLLYSVTNVFVFSILMSGRMGARYQDVPFAVYYFSGFVLWTLFADVVNRSTGIVREHAFLVNKVAFPVWLIPLISLASALLNQALIAAVLLALMLFYGVLPGGSLAWFVVPWLLCAALTLGLAYAVSALAVYVPDVAQLAPVAVNVLFFLTPILYPATIVEQSAPPWAKAVLMDWNPWYYLVEASRAAWLGTTASPALQHVGPAALAAGASLLLGLALFSRLRRGFADVL